MAYSDKVIDHYNNPRNVGSFDKTEDNVGTGIVGAPECGDVMKLQLKIQLFGNFGVFDLEGVIKRLALYPFRGERA